MAASQPSIGGQDVIVPMQDRVTFAELCRLLTSLKQKKGDAKVELLRSFFATWRREGSPDPEVDSMFPVVRLLLPQLDMVRGTYGLKEQKVADLYLDVLGLDPKKSLDGARLKNWRRDGNGHGAGDLALITELVLKDRVPTARQEHKITIRELNDNLDELAKCSKIAGPRGGARRDAASSAVADADARGGSPDSELASAASQTQATGSPTKSPSKGSSVASRRKAVFRFFQQYAPPEQHFWLIRIICGDLKIGLKETQVWKAFHEQASEYWGRCTQLPKICYELHLSSRKLLDQLQVGQPCGVMLALHTKKGVEKDIRAMGDSFIMEVKYDGERIHLHKNGSDFRYFSRNNKDFTSAYNTEDPERSHATACRPAFRGAWSCILDGEMMGYDLDTNEFMSKGEGVDVKALGRKSQVKGVTDTRLSAVQCFVVFDIIYLNGEPLYDRPLLERRILLEKHIADVPGRLHIAPHHKGTNLDDFQKFAQLCIDEAHEGVIIKNPLSPYALGSRTKDWVKWKPEYIGSLKETLDVLIVGGSYGEGSRGKGLVSHFLCAVAEPPPKGSPLGTRPPRFLTFAKIGSGYSLTKLRALNELLKPHWRKFDKRLEPCGMSSRVLLAMPGYKEQPDLWIEPHDSLIVQITAAQIQPSEKFAVGFTLRFPRVVSFREDKEWFDCMTTDDVFDLVSRSVGGNLASGTLVRQDIDGTHAPQRTRTVSAPVASVASTYKKVDVGHVNRESAMFEGMTFCVLVTPQETKNLIVESIVKHGGREVLYPDEKTVIVANKYNFQVKSRAKPHIDIVKPSWVEACVQLKQRVDFAPQYMHHASEETVQRMAEQADPFGDPYRQACTVSSFVDMRTRVFSENGAKVKLISHEQMAEIESEHLQLRPFRVCHAYFDRNAIPDDASTRLSSAVLDPLVFEFALLGGEVVPALGQECSHVIVNTADTSRLSAIFSAVYKWPQRPRVVSEAWLIRCLEDGSQLPELPFMLRVPDSVRAAHQLK